MNASERRFAYTAVKPGGEAVSDIISATDRQEALRRLAREKFVVTDIGDALGPRGEGAWWRSGKITSSDRILVLHQLAVMVGAGVELLEAVETIIAADVSTNMSGGLRETSLSLRRGDRFATAFAAGVPGYPPYVYALIRSGEASGQLDRVLREAVQQLGSEHRIRREIRSALAYPAFLVGAGTVAMTFLFLVVVPRFAAMIDSRSAGIDGLAGLVLGIGVGLRANIWLVLLAVAAVGFSTMAALRSPKGQRALASIAERMPSFGRLMTARQRSSWARIMAFATGAGVGIVEAAELAFASVPEGRFRQGLGSASRILRAGKPVTEAFGGSGALAPMDLSLLRAGQRSGALADMFRTIADSYEEEVRDRLKRTTVVIEQLAIAFVASAIGAVVLSLVSAMTSVYDLIG